jgi:hypothetical protein
VTFEEWLQSAEGFRCTEPLGSNSAEYLKNRLWAAYEAGKAHGIESRIRVTAINVDGCKVDLGTVKYELF